MGFKHDTLKVSLEYNGIIIPIGNVRGTYTCSDENYPTLAKTYYQEQKLILIK